MARSSLYLSQNPLITDTGGVLFPIVQGEQIEFPIAIEFLPTLEGYQFEAVVVEAQNEVGQTSIPKAIKPNGIQTVLGVRIPLNRGIWDAPQAYNTNEVVNHMGLWYRLRGGVARIDSRTPLEDPLWEEIKSNTIYIQVFKELSLDWSQQPTVDTPVYGYFELRVTEPNQSTFPQTWKPVRGPIEVFFSPTELVPG